MDAGGSSDRGEGKAVEARKKISELVGSLHARVSMLLSGSLLLVDAERFIVICFIFFTTHTYIYIGETRVIL